MNYTLTRIRKSEVEIRIILPFSEFEAHLKRAAIFISGETDIKGFRRGNASYAVVKEAVGEMALYERAADLAVRASYPQAVRALEEQGELPPGRPLIGRPEISVQKLAPGNDLEYVARSTLFPELTLPDYRVIAREVVLNEKKEITVLDDEMARALEWLRESRQALVTVHRSAAMGDAVEVDFTIRSGGVKIEEGESRNHPLVLGRGRFVPGYEESLVGMSAGEEKTVAVVTPDDWFEVELRGRVLEITTKMQLVQERNLPELNDTFAASVGNFPDVEALRASVRAGIKLEKEEAERRRLRAAIVAALLVHTAVEIPNLLVEAELLHMIAEFKANVERFGGTWEAYLLRLGKSLEELQKDWRHDAEKRAMTSLMLREIARKEEVKPSEEDITAFVGRARAELEERREHAPRVDEARIREYAIGVLEREQVFRLLESSEAVVS